MNSETRAGLPGTPSQRGTADDVWSLALGVRAWG